MIFGLCVLGICVSVVCFLELRQDNSSEHSSSLLLELTLILLVGTEVIQSVIMVDVDEVSIPY